MKVNAFTRFIVETNSRAKRFAQAIPIIRQIPAFDSVPKSIGVADLKFYSLANLVLTLGLFVHLHWIFLFYYYGFTTLSIVNVFSALVYVYSIYINRKGHFFVSSAIMVFEIIVHQCIAVYYFGLEVYFQNYMLVIAIFPFLMPKGNWFLKILLLSSSILAYTILVSMLNSHNPIYDCSEGQYYYLRITNSVFCFISLAISGAYFSLTMQQTEDLLAIEKNKTEELLLNILPEEVALELKETKTSAPKLYTDTTVLFTDFKDFTASAAKVSPEVLVEEINCYFSAFDAIAAKYNIEKIKTIGDAYLCAAGLPRTDAHHARHAVMMAKEILEFVEKRKKQNEGAKALYFDIRIGIHSGPVVAGIIGIKKFAYDIWGDTVNTAARIETNGEVNRINISGATYNLVKDEFSCEYRGRIAAKGKGEIDMYFVH
ncbi:MAG: Adenylate cyclase [Bacteroidota bacterium]|jgi:class 3 adenylate cyclase